MLISWNCSSKPARQIGGTSSRPSSAFGADKSVIARWRGNQLENLEAKQGLDTQQVASWVASVANRVHADEVRVDTIGVGGGVYDRLRALGCRNARAYNSSARPSNRQLYINARAEGFWKFREAIERGEVGLPDNAGLIAELSAIRYRFSPQGKIQIESKDELKPRLGRSPDLADAALIGWPGAVPVFEILIARA